MDAAAGNDVATVVEAWIRTQLTSPFDLGSGPLFRPRLLSIGATHHVLLLEMHHIIVDDWSIGPLLCDLSAAYGRHTSGSLPAIASTGTVPSSAASVGRRRMGVAALESELRWWEEYLDGARTDLGLPFERTECGALTRSSAEVPVALPRAVLEGLQEIADEEETTTFAVLFALFVSYLHCRTAREDLLIATPVAMRDAPEDQKTVGYLLNMLTVRFRIARGTTLRELAAHVRDDLAQVLRHRHVAVHENLAAPRQRD